MIENDDNELCGRPCSGSAPNWRDFFVAELCLGHMINMLRQEEAWQKTEEYEAARKITVRSRIRNSAWIGCMGRRVDLTENCRCLVNYLCAIPIECPFDTEIVLQKAGYSDVRQHGTGAYSNVMQWANDAIQLLPAMRTMLRDFAYFLEANLSLSLDDPIYNEQAIVEQLYKLMFLFNTRRDYVADVLREGVVLIFPGEVLEASHYAIISLCTKVGQIGTLDQNCVIDIGNILAVVDLATWLEAYSRSIGMDSTYPGAQYFDLRRLMFHCAKQADTPVNLWRSQETLSCLIDIHNGALAMCAQIQEIAAFMGKNLPDLRLNKQYCLKQAQSGPSARSCQDDSAKKKPIDPQRQREQRQRAAVKREIERWRAAIARENRRHRAQAEQEAARDRKEAEPEKQAEAARQAAEAKRREAEEKQQQTDYRAAKRRNKKQKTRVNKQERLAEAHRVRAAARLLEHEEPTSKDASSVSSEQACVATQEATQEKDPIADLILWLRSRRNINPNGSGRKPATEPGQQVPTTSSEGASQTPVATKPDEVAVMPLEGTQVAQGLLPLNRASALDATDETKCHQWWCDCWRILMDYNIYLATKHAPGRVPPLQPGHMMSFLENDECFEKCVDAWIKFFNLKLSIVRNEIDPLCLPPAMIVCLTPMIRAAGMFMTADCCNWEKKRSDITELLAHRWQQFWLYYTHEKNVGANPQSFFSVESGDKSNDDAVVYCSSKPGLK